MRNIEEQKSLEDQRKLYEKEVEQTAKRFNYKPISEKVSKILTGKKENSDISPMHIIKIDATLENIARKGNDSQLELKKNSSLTVNSSKNGDIGTDTMQGVINGQTIVINQIWPNDNYRKSTIDGLIGIEKILGEKFNSKKHYVYKPKYTGTINGVKIKNDSLLEKIFDDYWIEAQQRTQYIQTIKYSNESSKGK